MAIPGQSMGEDVLIGSLRAFFGAFNFIVTGAVLLSWFPQSRGVRILQPVFTVTDSYLGLFRGLLPVFGGIDFSPILGFVALNILSGGVDSLAAEIPPGPVGQQKNRNSQLTMKKLITTKKNMRRF